MKKSTYITVKHGRVMLLCRPMISSDKSAYQAIGTFADAAELKKLIEQMEEEK